MNSKLLSANLFEKSKNLFGVFASIAVFGTIAGSVGSLFIAMIVEHWHYIGRYRPNWGNVFVLLANGATAGTLLGLLWCFAALAYAGVVIRDRPPAEYAMNSMGASLFVFCWACGALIASLTATEFDHAWLWQWLPTIR
jgi:hypothetical protein